MDRSTDDVGANLGPALDRAATRRAFRRYTRRAVMTLLCGAAGMVVHTAVFTGLGKPESGPKNAAVILVGGVALVPLIAGLWVVANCVRIRRILARGPWQQWDVRYEVVGGGQPTVFQREPGTGVDRTLSVVAWRWRWDILDREGLWFAGDPRRGGVLSNAGGGDIVWARAPWSTGKRAYPPTLD